MTKQPQQGSRSSTGRGQEVEIRDLLGALQRLRAAYMMSRGEVSALTRDDSGSAYFSKSAVLAANAAAMGGPAR